MGRIDELFEELVPSVGPAESPAGEIVRAVSKIGYRFYNDGDHIAVGYGNETCNAPARFLIHNLPRSGSDIVVQMWGLNNDNDYEDGLNDLIDYVVEYIDDNPELREPWENPDDMLNYDDPDDYNYYEEDGM